MNPCCKGQRTPHCPMCGTRLWEAPLLEVIKHLRNLQNQAERRLERANQWVAKCEASRVGNKERSLLRVEKVSRQVSKWKSWADAVQEAVETLAMKGPPKNV